MNSFISRLIRGAEDRFTDEVIDDLPRPPTMVPAPEPKTFEKARSLLEASRRRLAERQSVLMTEIAVRQAELYETNRTLSAMDLAVTAINGERAEDPEQCGTYLSESELADVLANDLGVRDV